MSCYPFQSPLRQEQVLSRESIIAEIRKDVALMEHIIKLLGGVKMVSIDEVVGKPRKHVAACQPLLADASVKHRRLAGRSGRQRRRRKPSIHACFDDLPAIFSSWKKLVTC